MLDAHNAFLNEYGQQVESWLGDPENKELLFLEFERMVGASIAKWEPRQLEALEELTNSCRNRTDLIDGVVEIAPRVTKVSN